MHWLVCIIYSALAACVLHSHQYKRLSGQQYALRLGRFPASCRLKYGNERLLSSDRVSNSRTSPAIPRNGYNCCSYILYIIINEFVRAAARIPNLGGPVGFPLIGNLWQIRTNAAEQYRSWSKKYGGVYQVQLGNIPIVVVNTAAAAKVIFGQHSQALSSRPEFYTFHKVSQAEFCFKEHDDNLNLRYFPTQLAQQSAHLHTAIH